VDGNQDLRAAIDVMIAEQKRAKENDQIGALDKNGIFTGAYAVNPFNQEQIPIWIANYIVMDYGTGAIMSVPAHDERDYEFATKYGLEVRIVILPRRTHEPPEEGTGEDPLLPFTSEESLLINSGDYNGLACHEAQKKMAEYAEEHGFVLGHADPDALLRERRHRAGS
jgi:leucyl-tRNA synthetase